MAPLGRLWLQLARATLAANARGVLARTRGLPRAPALSARASSGAPPGRSPAAAAQPTRGGCGPAQVHGAPEELPSPASAVPDVRMADFHYDLPDDLIARYPAAPRGSSRLLVGLPPSLHTPLAEAVRTHLPQPAAALHDHLFADLPTLLPAQCHLVFNESKVFSARVFAHLPSNPRPVEVMFLSPEQPSPDPAAALRAPCGGQRWRCMVRSAAALPGRALAVEALVGPRTINLQVTVEEVYSSWQEEQEEDGLEVAVRLSSSDHTLLMADAFDAFGQVPLPPYLRRPAEPGDRATYQTVYARDEGSVAAPTAGLHFTPEVLDTLAQRGFQTSTVSLHVSAGTFRPVTAPTAAGHRMHEERFSVQVAELDRLAASLEAGRAVVPVGTTSVRVLESLYWIAVRAMDRPGSLDACPTLGQWEPYQLQALAARRGRRLPGPAAALRHLVRAAIAAGAAALRGATSVCLVPGYEFRFCDALVTNFHQPDSTLLLLVAALVGGAEPLRATYRHAVQRRYRFLSFGDASLLFNVRPRQPASDTAERLLEGRAEASNEPTAEAEDVVAAAATFGPRCEAAAARNPGSVTAGPRGRVLLHSCCAPCSGAMVEEMQAQGLDVTIFFYNPNIHPKEEYEMRKEENKRFAAQLGIPFVDADYDADEWFRRAKGMEFCPERGTRCSVCFDMRFERTALYAAEHGFQTVTTTNATSRWKDADQVNESGIKATAKYAGLQWWIRDWQTDVMTERKYRINAEQHFYKQEYCGCSYSLRDTNQYRKREGLPPVVVGGDSHFSDPVKDSEEESPDRVRRFFADTHSEEQERQRRLREEYRRRRKNAQRVPDNNW